MRKAIVTGGGSGIGRSIVRKFSEAGIETSACDVKETGSFSGNSPHSGKYYSVDLTYSDQIDRFSEEIKKTGESPDILVCNAGRGIHEKLTEGNPEVFL